MAARTEWVDGGSGNGGAGGSGGLAGGLMGGIALGALGMMLLSGLALGGASGVSNGGGVAEAAAFQVAGSLAAESGAGSAADLPAAPVIRFAPHAVGTVGRNTALWASPGGGKQVSSVLGGTAIEIGGKTRVPAGLGTREVLWVRVADGVAARFGFVAAEDVVLAAGDPPLLDLRGVSPEALVAPGLAVSHGSGEETRAPALPGEALRDASAPAAADGSTGAAASALSVASADVLAPPSTVDLPWLPDTVSRWQAEFVAAGAKYRVDPALLAIVTLVESGGNPRAVSPSGAVGLMQIMPPTGAGIAREKGVSGHTTERLYEPAYNIDFGAYYLAQQLRSFGLTDDADWQRSVELAASAYNGGPGSVQRYLGGGSLPAETQRYQRWVGGMWRERSKASPATLAAWLAAGGQGLVDRARAEW